MKLRDFKTIQDALIKVWRKKHLQSLEEYLAIGNLDFCVDYVAYRVSGEEVFKHKTPPVISEDKLTARIKFLVAGKLVDFEVANYERSNREKERIKLEPGMEVIVGKYQFVKFTWGTHAIIEKIEEKNGYRLLRLKHIKKKSWCWVHENQIKIVDNEK